MTGAGPVVFQINEADAKQIRTALEDAMWASKAEADVVKFNKALFVLADVMGEDIGDERRRTCRES